MTLCVVCGGVGIVYYEYEDGDHTHILDDICVHCGGEGDVDVVDE